MTAKSRTLWTFAITAALLGGFILSASAHSWYPQECCSDRDCAPLAESQTPKPLDGGDWLLTTGEVVPRAKVKWSPDGLYHLCRHTAGHIYCLFVPPQGS